MPAKRKNNKQAMKSYRSYRKAGYSRKYSRSTVRSLMGVKHSGKGFFR